MYTHWDLGEMEELLLEFLSALGIVKGIVSIAQHSWWLGGECRFSLNLKQ